MAHHNPDRDGTCPHFPFPPPPDGTDSGGDPLGLPAIFAELPPVSQVTLSNGKRAHLVTGYRECVDLLRSENVFRRAGADAIPPFPPTTGTIAAMDGPEHRTVRGLIDNTFSPARVKQLRPMIAEIVADLVKHLPNRHAVEVHSTLGMPLTLQVIGRLLYIPDHDLDRLAAWGDMFLSSGQDRLGENRRAMGELIDYLRPRMSEAQQGHERESPTGLLREMVANAADRGVSLEQAVSLAATLVIAGWETTAGAVATHLYRLLTAKEPGGDTLYRVLSRHPERVPGAVEELLRTTPAGTFSASQPRIAARDYLLGNVLVRASDVVIPSLDAANRDPAKFESADRLDFLNPGAGHLRFGFGRHVCPGAPLARLELTTLLEYLVAKAPKARLGQPVEEVQWNSATAIRRPTALWIDLEPAT